MCVGKEIIQCVVCCSETSHVSARTKTTNISSTLYIVEEMAVMCLALEGSVC